MQVGTDWDGDYSRFSFDETDQYMMVLKNQGVELTDDELNLMGEIPLTLLRRMISDAFGNACPGDAFQIVGTSANNDFTITGGDNTLKGAAHAYVGGWMALLLTSVAYSAQPVAQAALTTPGSARVDEVYLDLWHEEYGPADDGDMNDPVLNKETSRRLKLRWAVKVAEGGATPADYTDGNSWPHWTYHIATINRTATAAIDAGMVVDERSGMLADPVISTEWDGEVRALPTDGNNLVFTREGGSVTKNAVAAWSAGHAGGLLVDALAANTTYAVYAIVDAAGAVDYIGSTGLATPTSVPAGYSVLRLISLAVTDGSSNIRPFAQSGRKIQYIKPWMVISNVSAAVSKWDGPVTANIHTGTIGGCLPNKPVQVHIRADGGVTSNWFYVHVAHPSHTISLSTDSFFGIDAASDVYEVRTRGEVVVDASRQVKYTVGTEALGNITIEFIILGTYV